MIEKISLKNFSVFNQLDVEFSPKINIIIGENGTGKTHLLKAVYALCSANNKLLLNTDGNEEDISTALKEKLVNTFKPLDNKLGKIHRSGETENALVAADFIAGKRIAFTFHNNSRSVAIQENNIYERYSYEPVFIPTKEVLSFMEGFVSLYNKYQLSFDTTYYDLCSLLDLPVSQEDRLTEKTKWAMDEIEKVVGGKFIFHGGGRVTFRAQNDEYSINAIAEGFRKAGILSRLLETGAIQPGASGPLLWDEPEANLNPKLIKFLVEILLDLSRNGQQIVLATHDYVLIKWFDLLMDKNKGDHIKFHTLHYDSDSAEIKYQGADDYRQIDQNPISKTYSELYDADINKSFGDL